MAEVNGSLLILHSLAPCVTFLRFEPSAPKGLVLHSMTCYNDQVRTIRMFSTGCSVAQFCSSRKRRTLDKLATVNLKQFPLAR